MITFETLDIDTCELAWAIWAAGDAETLDGAAALAVALRAVLAPYAQEWDQDAGFMLMPEGDLLDVDGLRVA